MIPISYNVRSIFVRKSTSAATALGIGLVVFVLAASQMLANGLTKTLGRSGRRDYALVMRKGADAELSSGIDQALVNQIKAAPEVRRDPNGQPLAAGEVLLVLALEREGGEAGLVTNVPLRGVPENVLSVRDDAAIVQGRALRPGTNEVMIGSRIAGSYRGIALGKTFVLNKNQEVKVVGVFSANGSSFESEIWADVDTLRGTFGRQGMVSSVTLALQSAASFDSFRLGVEEDKQLGLHAMRQRDYFEKQSESTALFVRVLGLGIVVFFSIGAMIGAMITMYAAVQNRKREIGTMRALGFSRRTIMASFLLESFVLAILGGALGAFTSLAMGFVEFSMMNFASWSEIVFRFEATPAIVTSSLMVGGLMGIVGGLFPAIHAAAVSPLAAMRE